MPRCGWLGTFWELFVSKFLRLLGKWNLNTQVWLIGHSAGSHLCAMLLSSPWYDGLPTAARKVFLFSMWSYQKIRTSIECQVNAIIHPWRILSSQVDQVNPGVLFFPGDSWSCFIFRWLQELFTWQASSSLHLSSKPRWQYQVSTWPGRKMITYRSAQINLYPWCNSGKSQRQKMWEDDQSQECTNESCFISDLILANHSESLLYNAVST